MEKVAAGPAADGKRKRPLGRSGGAGRWRQKRAKSSSRIGSVYKFASNNMNLKEGHGGFIVSCDKNKEQNAAGEILVLLDEIARGEEDDVSDSDSDTGINIQKAIDEEIRSMRSASTSKFCAATIGMNGLFYVNLNDAGSSIPDIYSKLVTHIISGDIQIKFVKRVIPVQKICFPDRDDVIGTVKYLIEKNELDLSGKKLRVRVKKRGGLRPSLNFIQMELETKLRMAPNSAIILRGKDKDQDYTECNVEFFKSYCGVSFIENIPEVKEYNLSTLTGNE